MNKTLLLCFIHGFKGGDDTFGDFPQHLQALVSQALPNITVASITYPKFETRGDLKECVARFKEWLQNKVIDLEVEKGTPSPMVDPSVRTVLIGHSMGGIVAAEAVLSITSERPITASSMVSDDTSSLMFPYIQGILAFDTPYLGVAPSVVAHGAENQWNTAAAAYTSYNNAVRLFDSNGERNATVVRNVDASRMLPAPPSNTASAPLWQRWGRYAMYAGAAGALAAGGAAAYVKRDKLTEGWTWVGSHLAFVGCLARGEELKNRLVYVVKLEQTHGFGFANFYAALGAAVVGKSVFAAEQPRTFCTIPKSDLKRYFYPVVNDAARTETWAHMSMFIPKINSGYYRMSEEATKLIATWTENQWYAGAIDEDEVAVEKLFVDAIERVDLAEEQQGLSDEPQRMICD